MNETPRVLEVALVNNMPDQALAATVLQFSRLVRANSGDAEVRWRCYALPSILRSDTARRYLARSHDDIEALYTRGADALIVTGCEPRAAALDAEPYWPDLARLVDWARDHTRTTIWSCLAAHAAVLRLDGLARRPAGRKISGVYDFDVDEADWRSGDAHRIAVPHSRYNGLDREDLESAGYKIVSATPEIGVDCFWRVEPSLFVFLQGHPEYDSDGLLKEYRRDVTRFLSGESHHYPHTPVGYFSSSTFARLNSIRARALSGEKEIAIEVSATLAQPRPASAWQADAAQLFRDWMTYAARVEKPLRISA